MRFALNEPQAWLIFLWGVLAGATPNKKEICFDSQEIINDNTRNNLVKMHIAFYSVSKYYYM